MEHVIVYADDAGRARAVIVATRRGPTHWVLVACPPRATQRSGWYASRATRERWRRHWAQRLLADVRPLAAPGDRFSLVLDGELEDPGGPAAARVVDARRGRDPSGPGAMLPACSSSWSSGC